LDPRPFLRDAGFYFFSLLVMLIVLLDGMVYLYEALFLVCIYVAYLIFTIYGER
jgi:sodium/potassium/calcium exchanger 6